MRVLASRPFTLTEMDQPDPGRQLSIAGATASPGCGREPGRSKRSKKEGRGTPYVVTDWLRYAIAPLCVAGRCERRYMGEGEQVRLPTSRSRRRSCSRLLWPCFPGVRKRDLHAGRCRPIRVEPERGERWAGRE